MTPEQFQDLITAAGPLEERIVAITGVGPDLMVITFEGIDVDVEHDAERDRVIFTAPIGAIPQARAAAIHRFLLLSNALYRTSGGVVAALTGAGDEAALIVSQPLAGLTPARVAIVALNLGERALGLAEGFAAGLAQDGPDLPVADGDAMMLRL